MKNFIVIENESGGCDYTIGCGTRVLNLKADSLEDAFKKYEERFDDTAPSTMRIDSVEIIEVANIAQFDIAALKNKMAKAAKEREEALEVERLQRRLAELHNRAMNL